MSSWTWALFSQFGHPFRGTQKYESLKMQKKHSKHIMDRPNMHVVLSMSVYELVPLPEESCQSKMHNFPSGFLNLTYGFSTTLRHGSSKTKY